MECIIACTASISGAQSSVSIVDLLPRKREKSSSSVHKAQDFPLLTPPSTVQDIMFSRLDCFATLAEVRSHCFDVVQVPIQWCHACAEPREDACMSLGEVVIDASSVVPRPGNVNSA